MIFFDYITKTLKIKVKNIRFYEIAFTHSSSVKHDLLKKNADYENLEFFGDSIIDFIVARYLYSKFENNIKVKQLTKIKNYLISGIVLAKVANRLKFQKYIRSSPEVWVHGSNISILSDVFESLVAAIYCDVGLKKTTSFVLQHLIKKHFDEAINKVDYRTTLQELCQRLIKKTPKYRYFENNQKFICVCKFQKFTTQATAFNKKDAARKAAKLMLKIIGQNSEQKLN